MSGFDDNPFDDNPFKDPAIQQVTRNTANTAAKDLEDYNPFDDGNNQQKRPIPGGNPGGFGESRSPAVMSPHTQETAPTFGSRSQPPPQSQGQISTEELQRRQEELERKARELERREEELRSNPYNEPGRHSEDIIELDGVTETEKNVSARVRRNNWPPLPEFLPVQPCFYQDINVDIPVEFQRIVRHLYYLWVLHAIILTVNSLVWILRLFTLAEFTTQFTGLFLSLIYIIVFTPASYLCWFRPAYKAFRSDSSFNFMVFFFIFFFQFVVAIFLAIYMSGSCGFVDGYHTIDKGGALNIFVGILIMIVGIGFITSAVLDFIMLMRVHKIYRSSGASFAKAQQEFASGVMRNEHVQGAAANIASEAVRQQFRSPGPNGAGTAPPPRY